MQRNGLILGLLFFVLLALPMGVGAASLLIPMDEVQTDHLKAYGVVYRALDEGNKGEDVPFTCPVDGFREQCSSCIVLQQRLTSVARESQQVRMTGRIEADKAFAFHVDEA